MFYRPLTVLQSLSFFVEQTRKGMVMLREMLISEEVEKRELLESLLGRLSDHDISFKEILKSNPKKLVHTETTVL